MTTVLVIDDNDVDREQIRRLLAGRHDLIEAATAREGLRAVSDRPVDCVLLDYRLPDDDGVHVLDQMSDRLLPIVMLTAQGSERVAVTALKHGAADYLVKSELSRDRLQKAIEIAIEQGRLRQALDRNQRELQLAVSQLSAQRNELAAANAALERRESDLRFVLSQLPVVHWTTDAALTITRLGGAGLDALGVAAATRVGQPIERLFGDAKPVDELVALHEGALEGRAGLHLAQVDGRSYQLHLGALRDARNDVVGTIGLALDVTEARALEQQLRHAVKMDALGQLAGGVAHDFNNLLSVILGFSGFVYEALPAGSKVRDDVVEVIAASNKAAILVRQLLTFSRFSSAPPRVVEPDRVVEATLPMLRRLVGEDITLGFAAAPGGWRVRIDPNALEQVIVNLVVNARDAMSRGGRIDIEVKHLGLEEELVHSRGHRLAAGDYVVLCVSDEGGGIPRELIERVFDPFFTTKEVGHGTGLGLSTVYGIATQVGGGVTVYSEVGRGSSFRVYLPRALQPAEAARPARGLVPRGTETVLVVEDEAPVRAVAVRVLERLGYTVVEAADGSAALARCAELPGVIDLVVTDVVLPGMAGTEVVRALQAARPSMRALYMSGYTDRAARDRGALPAEVDLIEKPLTLVRLGCAVRAVLDGAKVDPAAT